MFAGFRTVVAKAADVFKPDHVILLFGGVLFGCPSADFGIQIISIAVTDIQKPYFEEAVNTLEMFPNDLIIPQIEKYVEQAHKEGDVLFGAGLLYLSKRIGYEISLKRADSTEVELQESESEFEKLVMAQGKM